MQHFYKLRLNKYNTQLLIHIAHITIHTHIMLTSLSVKDLSQRLVHLKLTEMVLEVMPQQMTHVVVDHH